MSRTGVEMVSEDLHLSETRRAFDHAAADYDGPSGNNMLIQRMRHQMWQTLTATFPLGSRLLDLGCGPGIDVAYLAAAGYSVLGTDWSTAMVEQTRARLSQRGLAQRAAARTLGSHELDLLAGERFDGIYSNFGPLNCAPDLPRTARDCAALLAPGGPMVVSVIGRICPWEMAYYAAHFQWQRAVLRWNEAAVPVPLDGEVVWTRYYTPRQFYAAFASEFELVWYRGLRLLSPPPYMLSLELRLRPLCALGEWLDERLAALPVMRNAGDHFLMVLSRRS